MSHSKERKEKICLNCNTELNGRFCHVCGQENLEPKESAWSLISHFFYDITHFDGKFFGTLGHLVTKPGFLSKEYIRGRRASYLNPIRMYVFSSALFFIIFFSMYDVRQWDIGGDSEDDRDIYKLKSTEKAIALKYVKTREDSLKIEEYFAAMAASDSAKRESTKRVEIDTSKGWRVQFTDDSYRTRAEYDSIERSKAPEDRDGWFSRRLNYRFIELNERYNGDDRQILRELFDKFIHTFPYLLFVSLPLYALYLKLLYIRRKQFYYVDHGIFLVHLYIFTFITLLLFFAFSKLSNYAGWGWLGILQTIIIIYGVFYTIKAMRNFYAQGWGKTLLKFILLNILAFFTLVFLFAGFFLFAAFRI